MTTYEQLKASIAFASNSPGTPTGYGQQGSQLISRMLRHGMKVAALSNYGLEGQQTELVIDKHKIPHYPKGLTTYSGDVIPVWAQDFFSKHPDNRSFLFTLYDVWVYNQMKYDGPIVSWVPLDHLTVTPAVREFLVKENVIPVTMAPHGQELLESIGIKSTYIPHGIDTKIYKPTHEIQGTNVRDFMGVPQDAFLVGMVAANKANGQIHRKAYAENLLAFAMHLKKHPDSLLYIHTEPSRGYGGFDIAVLLKAMGIPKENVLMPDPYLLRAGYPEEHMAGFYTAMDVLLCTSYGEGFGLPTVEAQACGTRVITSNYAASKDLASEDSWKVDGQPFWDEAQGSFFQIPSVNGITNALNASYEAERGRSQKSIDFAKQFDADLIWDTKWVPFWKELLA
jgi:glycosyltransferase involved in cell wall biosynthesis